MSTWVIPNGASVSNSVWFGLEGILGCIAPAMTATTTGLQLQASADPMSTPDDDATFADITVEGELAKFVVAAAAGQADTLTNIVRYNRVRVKAVSDADAAVTQTGAKTIEASTVRL